MIKSLNATVKLSNNEELTVLIENDEVFILRESDYGEFIADMTLQSKHFETDEISLLVPLAISDQINIDTLLAHELIEQIYDLVKVMQ